MPKDIRRYITVHNGMPDHPKIAGLSDAGFRLLVTLWCWCDANETDGKVRRGVWDKKGRTKARSELLGEGLVVELPGGDMEVHDYLEHQRSADEIAALRLKRQQAGSKGGKTTASAKANAQASAVANGQQDASKIQAAYSEELARHTSSKDGARERFDEFWSTYPRREARPAAEKAWERAVKRAEPEVIIKAAQQYRDDPNRDEGFTAHASTWLNQDRWNDPPIPGKAKPQPANNIDPATGKPKSAGWEFGM